MDNGLESVKLSLENINDLRDVKENPVVSSVLLAPMKAIPVIGELLDSSIDKSLEIFQQKKRTRTDRHNLKKFSFYYI